MYTFRINFHMDDVSHDGRPMEVLRRLSRAPHRVKDYLCNSQVLLVLGIVEYFHVFDVPIFVAHVSEKRLPHIVVQLGKRHFFGRNGANVPLINLKTRDKLDLPLFLITPLNTVSIYNYGLTTLNLGSLKSVLLYLLHRRQMRGSLTVSTGNRPMSSTCKIKAPIRVENICWVGWRVKSLKPRNYQLLYC